MAKHVKTGEHLASRAPLRQEASSLLDLVQLISTVRRIVASRIRTFAELSFPWTAQRRAKMGGRLVSRVSSLQVLNLSLAHVLLIPTARPHAVNKIRTYAEPYYP